MSYFSINGKFVITLLLQVQPGKVESAKSEIKKLLENEKKIVIDSKIFNAFGKHDLICFLYSEKLEELIDVVYLLVHFVDGIRDYSKIAGFNWCNISNNSRSNNKIFPLCITLIKLDLINSNSNTIETIVNVIKKIENEINNLDGERIFVEINGCFGWHELSCVFHSESYKSISDFIEKLRQYTKDNTLSIWSTSTIPLVHPTKLIKESECAAVLVYCKPGWDAYTRDWLKQRNYSIVAKFGIYDFVVSPPTGIKIPFKKILEIKHECKGVRDTATFIMTDTLNEKNKDTEKMPKEVNVIHSTVSPEQDFKERKEQFDTEREKGNIISLKLLAFETICKMLRRTSIYSYLLPPNLESMIEEVRKNIKFPIFQNEFLKHMRYMFQQRFSGSQVEGLLGIEGGLLEQMGGYQKMVLASESIPYMSLKNKELLQKLLPDVKSENNLDTLSNIFIVFEHDPGFSGHCYTFDGEEAEILHMPMVKYNPFFWIFSLHEIGEHFSMKGLLARKIKEKYNISNTKEYLENKDKYFNLIGQEALEKAYERLSKYRISKDDIDEKYIRKWEAKYEEIGKTNIQYIIETGKEIIPDTFACNFISKKVYGKIFKEYAEQKNLLPDILIRFGVIEQESITQDSLIKEYTDLLQKGKLIVNFSDGKKDDVCAFFSYVEAYCALSEEKRRSSKCLASFVLSLYNQRLKIQKKMLMNSYDRN